MQVPTTHEVYRYDGTRELKSESPFYWNGDLHQLCIVEGIVTATTLDIAHFVVTRVLDGYDHATDDFYRPFQSLDEYNPWSDELPLAFRPLQELSAKQCDLSDAARYASQIADHVRAPADMHLVPGNRIHVHEYVFYGNAGGTNVGIQTREVCKIPGRAVDPLEQIEMIARRRQRLAAQAVRTLARVEQRVMSEQPRISPDDPVEPFAQPDHRELATYGSITARYVFGDGVVADHFVDVTAIPSSAENMQLMGVNLTASGNCLVTPYITPFGPPRTGEPVSELEIKIHSSTVHNPAVGEQKVFVEVDGVLYEACIEPETSSHYFEQPGHHVVFGGFKRPNKPNDTIVLTGTDAERYFDIVYRGSGADPSETTWAESVR